MIMRTRTIRTLFAMVIVAATTSAAPQHSLLLREATTAAKAGDTATALEKMEAAAKLRPDYPRVQLNLARLYAGLQRPDDAIAALERLAEMGLQMNVAADPSFTPLKDLSRFQALAARLTSPLPPVGPADEAAFAITGVTGIIESCLVDPETLLWYFGDVRNRCVWRRDVSSGVGELIRFTREEDALDGVFKIALSADRKTLWAATAAVGVMGGTPAEDGTRTALVAIDFATGRVHNTYPVPADGRKHLLGDFLLAADGSIYATDSMSPVIWRLPAGGIALEPWLESEDFLSLQGVALNETGTDLYVADYANGLWRISTATKTPVLLTAPANATFFGIDGLYAVPGGLLAVQNGVNPQRVLRLDLPLAGPTSARIVAQGRSTMTDLALGQVFNGRFHVVGNSGWSLFDPPPPTPPAPRRVTIWALGTE